MNNLPTHRHAAAGRTWDRVYRPEHYAPIQHVHQSRTERMAGVIVAVVIGVLGAMALVHWWAS